MRRLLDTSGGIVREFLSDNEGRCAVRSTQDAEPALDYNAFMREQKQIGELRLIAVINPVMFEEVLRMSGLSMRDFYQKLARHEREALIRKFLNNPDYKKFRAVERL